MSCCHASDIDVTCCCHTSDIGVTYCCHTSDIDVTCCCHAIDIDGTCCCHASDIGVTCCCHSVCLNLKTLIIKCHCILCYRDLVPKRGNLHALHTVTIPLTLYNTG